jgi:hypothetical protein
MLRKVRPQGQSASVNYGDSAFNRCFGFGPRLPGRAQARERIRLGGAGKQIGEIGKALLDRRARGNAVILAGEMRACSVGQKYFASRSTVDSLPR